MPPVFLALVGSCLLVAQTATAELKAITVDINKLFNEYHVTQKEMSVLKTERDNYLKERKDRQKSLTEVTDKIKTVMEKIRNKAMPKTEKDNLIEEYEELVSRYNALLKDFKESDHDQLRETKAKIAEARRKGLDAITKVVKQYAKDKGYHWIMETSGVSNTQISPLVYAKNAKDKTDEILAILNKDAPKEDKKKPTPDQPDKKP